MNTPVKPTPSAPASLRWMMYFLNALFSILLIYLLGFLIRDIVSLERPDRSAISQELVDQALVDRRDELNQQIKNLDIQIQRQREIQQTLKASMDNARETMNQMMGLYRLSLEQEIKPNATEQEALAESQTRFLAAQNHFESANLKIADSNQEKYQLSQEVTGLDAQIKVEYRAVDAEYNRQYQQHRFKVAAFKLGLIVPLFLLSAFLFHRFQNRLFRPVFGACLFATGWRMGVVMFDAFPREFFKYIAILAAIATVLVFLVWLLRRMMRPDTSLLVRRYREGYVRHQCPVCAQPIMRGVLRHAFWRGKKAFCLTPGCGTASAQAGDEEGAYICPSCGTALFEECGKCGKVRRSLLPFCEHCGDVKTVDGSA